MNNLLEVTQLVTGGVRVSIQAVWPPEAALPGTTLQDGCKKQTQCLPSGSSISKQTGITGSVDLPFYYKNTNKHLTDSMVGLGLGIDYESYLIQSEHEF